MVENCDSTKHERELREMWEEAHLRIHEQEASDRSLARVEINRRLDEMNKLREQINQERGFYVTRDLHDKLEDSLDTRLKLLENTKSNIEGRLWMIGGIISAIVVLVDLFLRYFIPIK